MRKIINLFFSYKKSELVSYKMIEFELLETFYRKIRPIFLSNFFSFIQQNNHTLQYNLPNSKNHFLILKFSLLYLRSEK